MLMQGYTEVQLTSGPQVATPPPLTCQLDGALSTSCHSRVVMTPGNPGSRSTETEEMVPSRLHRVGEAWEASRPLQLNADFCGLLCNDTVLKSKWNGQVACQTRPK